MPPAAIVAGGMIGSALINRSAAKSANAGQSTTVQDSSPWGPQQDYLLDIYRQGSHVFNNLNSGATPLSPQTLQAQNLMTQRATQGSPLTQAAQDQNLATMRGDYLDLSKNPGVKNAMDMARTQINSQFTGDNYGNSAHQEWLGRGLLNAASPFYESERQRQVGATALAPTLANQDYTDIGQLGSVGAAIDARPWENVFNYQRAIMGANAGGGSVLGSSTQPYFTNPLASALGGGLGGLALYNGLNQSGLLSAGGGGMVSEMVPGQFSLGNPAYG